MTNLLLKQPIMNKVLYALAPLLLLSIFLYSHVAGNGRYDRQLAYFSLIFFPQQNPLFSLVIGGALFMIIRNYDFIRSAAYAASSGIGWLLAIMMSAGIRSKLKEKLIPAGLQGAGISLIITGITAPASAGFSGIVNVRKKPSIL